MLCDQAGKTIIGGVDFGTAQVIPETPFGECGPLCAGCLPDYLQNTAAYEAHSPQFC